MMYVYMLVLANHDLCSKATPVSWSELPGKENVEISKNQEILVTGKIRAIYDWAWQPTRWSDTIFQWNHFSKELQKDFLERKTYNRSNIRTNNDENNGND